MVILLIFLVILPVRLVALITRAYSEIQRSDMRYQVKIPV